MNLAAMGGVWMYAGGGEGLSAVSLFYIAAFEKASRAAKAEAGHTRFPGLDPWWGC